MIHQKKIESKYFNKITNGTKPYEIRINDCDYRMGDYIGLNEKGEETGFFILVKVVDILEDYKYTKENHVIMTIAPCSIAVRNIGSSCCWYGKKKSEVE